MIRDEETKRRDVRCERISRVRHGLSCVLCILRRVYETMCSLHGFVAPPPPLLSAELIEERGRLGGRLALVHTITIAMLYAQEGQVRLSVMLSLFAKLLIYPDPGMAMQPNPGMAMHSPFTLTMFFFHNCFFFQKPLQGGSNNREFPVLWMRRTCRPDTCFHVRTSLS